MATLSPDGISPQLVRCQRPLGLCIGLSNELSQRRCAQRGVAKGGLNGLCSIETTRWLARTLRLVPDVWRGPAAGSRPQRYLTPVSSQSPRKPPSLLRFELKKTPIRPAAVVGQVVRASARMTSLAFSLIMNIDEMMKNPRPELGVPVLVPFRGDWRVRHRPDPAMGSTIPTAGTSRHDFHGLGSRLGHFRTNHTLGDASAVGEREGWESSTGPSPRPLQAPSVAH